MLRSKFYMNIKNIGMQLWYNRTLNTKILLARTLANRKRENELTVK